MKVAARNIVIGMEFEVISHDDCISLGIDPDDNEFIGQKRCNPPIGSILVITKAAHKIWGSQRIEFKVKNDTRKWSSYVSVFGKNTKLMEGQKVIETKVNFKPLSQGPFNGFDLELDSAKYEIGVIEFRFKLVGEAEGVKKGILSTKNINTIKKSPGFREKMIKLIFENLSQNETIVNDFMNDEEHTTLWRHHYSASSMATHYSGGKIEFKIMVFEDLETIKTNVCKMVEVFVRANSTSQSLYNKEIDILQLMVIRTLAEEN